jgi:triosephosphate isomerase
MNVSPSEAADLILELREKVDTEEVDVIFCVPYVDLDIALLMLKGTSISVGVQNMHYADNGAYTGEISAKMISSMSVRYVIIGHSERRQYFAETDITVNLKLIQALKAWLIPIVCVGETLEQRDLGVTIEYVRTQVKIAFRNISANDAKRVIIAYEPIWAIGTGRTATSEQAEEVCAAIRQVIREIYDIKTADEIRIQYGGSVKADNANELFNMPNIDGGLVGGASITSEFIKIVNYNGAA